MAVEMEEGTWGPPSKEISIGLKELGIPYAPYAKADRFGKIADWIGPVARQQTQPRMRPNALIPGTGLGTGASSTQPAATARPGQPSTGASDDSDQPDSEYTFVDTRPAPRTKGWQQRGAGRAQSGRFPPGSSGRSQQGPQPQSGAAAVAATGAWGSGPPGQRGAGGGAGRGDGRGRGQQQQQGGRGFQGDRRENAVQYSPSVEVRPEWNVLEQVQLSQLTKLSYDVKEAEDLKTCGRLRKYNKVLDRITPRAERRLQRFQGVEFPNPTASDDPYLQELSDLDEGSVFITDSVLAAIMCATRSVFSWDIVITKSGSKLWFDKRRKSKFEQLTVHETAQLGSQLEEGYDSINRVQPLCEEATITNANFSQMALDENSPVQELEDEAPFIDASKRDNTAPKAYRYRRWKLEEGVSVVVRTEIDCLCELRGEDVYSLAKSVNEFDPRWTGMDWRKKIETQRGAVLATELKNNANKLAKWTCQAMLADVSILKLGYVSRQSPRNNKAHSIVQMQTYKPKDFATQINLSHLNMWGIFKSIVDICRKQEDGKLLLVKDPNKALLRLYELPPEETNAILGEEETAAGGTFEGEAPPGG